MPFEISFDGFNNFFLGMATGAITFSVIFIVLLIRGKYLNIENVKRSNVDEDEEVLKLIIKTKRELFKRNRKLGDKSITKLTLEMSYELVDDIATYFFPDSKYPMLELNVHELLDLNHHITNKINGMLDKPLLKHTMNLRMTQITGMFDKKKQLQENKVFKTVKKYKVAKYAKHGWNALNISNPNYWIRKFTFKTSKDVAINKICTIIIGAVGEETVKIYSKKALDKTVKLDMIDSEMDIILEEGIEDNENEIKEN